MIKVSMICFILVDEIFKLLIDKKFDLYPIFFLPGTMVASACKSSNPQEAAIIIWNTKTWKQVHSTFR